jgi:hypothetical protein
MAVLYRRHLGGIRLLCRRDAGGTNEISYTSPLFPQEINGVQYTPFPYLVRQGVHRTPFSSEIRIHQRESARCHSRQHGERFLSFPRLGALA